MVAEQDRPGVLDQRQDGQWFTHHEFQMLRGEDIGKRQRLFERVRFDENQVVRGHGQYLFPGQRFALLGEFVFTFFQELCRVAEHDAPVVVTVFCLGQQIGGGKGRVRALIGDNGDFGRAGEHIDADFAVDEFLGGVNIGIAGANDDIALRHGFRAVGHCRNGLCAADFEDAAVT